MRVHQSVNSDKERKTYIMLGVFIMFLVILAVGMIAYVVYLEYKHKQNPPKYPWES